jgi:hypothetical protein
VYEGANIDAPSSPSCASYRHIECPEDYCPPCGGGGFAGAVSLGGGVSAGVSGDVVVLGGVVLGSPEFPPGVVAVSPAPGAVVVVSDGGGVSVLGSRGPQAANIAAAAQSGIRTLVLMGTPESGEARSPYARINSA